MRKLADTRLASLLAKEFHQIFRDRQLVSLLVIPPVLQILLYGFALSPDVKHLRLAVLDQSQSSLSRDITAALVESDVFDLTQPCRNLSELSRLVADGSVDVGAVYPPDLYRDVKRRSAPSIQFLLDGVDANTAGIAQGYISQIVDSLNRRLAQRERGSEPFIQPAVTFVYNPGLIASWFFVPGVMGLVVVIAGTLVSSISVIREKDTGTLEQLLMTPASPLEILIAKVVPLIMLLSGSVLMSLALARLIFHAPLRGSFFDFLSVSLLAVLVAVSVGMALATVSGNQRQAILTSFFINLPLIQLSGGIAPIESMPEVLQQLSLLDPLRYYVSALRAILLKGVGLELIWREVLALMAFAVVLFTVSATQFRKQLT